MEGESTQMRQDVEFIILEGGSDRVARNERKPGAVEGQPGYKAAASTGCGAPEDGRLKEKACPIL